MLKFLMKRPGKQSAFRCPVADGMPCRAGGSCPNLVCTRDFAAERLNFASPRP
jgi:hypothetical protein